MLEGGIRGCSEEVTSEQTPGEGKGKPWRPLGKELSRCKSMELGVRGPVGRPGSLGTGYEVPSRTGTHSEPGSCGKDFGTPSKGDGKPQEEESILLF